MLTLYDTTCDRIDVFGIHHSYLTMQIEIIYNPLDSVIKKLGCYSWPIWSKEPSTFPWKYDEKETCLILEGAVVVTPDGGDPYIIVKGNLVTFQAGLSCTWRIQETVRKHYKFG